MEKKRFLFFFVHPSKYHLFKHVINRLISNGHIVDVAIISKDVLESLVKNEGWSYENIFPEGRRSKKAFRFSILFSTVINFIKTVWRLYALTKGKKYDAFITDDCLSVIGRLKRVPTYMFIDDDIDVVPENSLLYAFATKIVSPVVTKLGMFKCKKLEYNGYHEYAYLAPGYFVPNEKVVEQIKAENPKYFIIRLVSLTASHDINKVGIDDEKVDSLLSILEKHGKVYISSERPLADKYESYRLVINPKDIAHVLYFADMFIGDSQTMNTEAALLGTPAIRYNDFVGKISTMNEIEFKYGLSFGYSTDNFSGLIDKVKELVNDGEVKNKWKEKLKKLHGDKEDVNEFIFNLLINMENN